jgi:signal transduction histidine kinase
VMVDDDGPGVGDEVRERLFAPFASTKPSGGLGLALARRLARLHGGDVTHEARPGKGARFVVTLPRGEGA